MAILIADCGGTKGDWALVLSIQSAKYFTTKGFNPVVESIDQLNYTIKNELAEIDSLQIDEIFYSGAGCSTSDNKNLIQSCLKTNFPNSLIHVSHDIEGSAIACLGNNRGIACILGTGSNVCYWDGAHIVDQPFTFGLGYILGDEGSGSYFGKSLLKTYFNDELNSNLKEKLELIIGDKQSVFNSIYKQENANVYLASLTKYISQNIDDIQINDLVINCFKVFVESHLLKYKDCKSVPVSFVGSIAFYFEKQLREVLDLYDLKLGKIVRKPIEELANFHSNT